MPTLDYVTALLSNSMFHTWVALDNDRVVGGLTAYTLPMYMKQETEMFLYEIGVSEPYRTKGIAKRLVENLKEFCVDNGIGVMFVGTEPGNTPAHQLYKTTGGSLEEVSWFTYNMNVQK